MCTQWPHLVGFALLVMRDLEYDDDLVPSALMSVGAHLAAFFGAAIVAAVAPGIALVLSTAGAVAPWLTCGTFLGRAWFGLAGVVVHLRLCQLLSDKDESFRNTSVNQRLCFLYWIAADMRTAKFIAHPAERSILVKYFLTNAFRALCVCTVASQLLFSPPVMLETVVEWRLCQWTLMFLFFFNSMHMLDVVYNFPLLLMEGYAVDRVMDSPLLGSDSLRDFWAKRWDRPIQSLFRDCAYLPARRAGLTRTVSVFLAFAASGALHCYGLFLAGLRPREHASQFAAMGVFFAIQPFLIALEKSMGRNKFVSWHYALSLFAPLFFEPLLSINLKGGVVNF